MLHEVNKQAEWGVHVGQRILDGTSGNLWADLQLFASHAGSVGAFLDTLDARRSAIARSFPDRSPLLRSLTRTAFDFGPVLAIRNGIAHVDERIEERWQMIASVTEDPPELLVRAEGRLDDGRDRMLNWDSGRRVIAFRKRPREGEGFAEVEVQELVDVLEALRIESSRACIGVLFGMRGLGVPQSVAETSAEGS